jgi:hypothetical protein
MPENRGRRPRLQRRAPRHPGSARVSRAGDGVSPSRTLFTRRIVSAGRRVSRVTNQHARHVRYPDGILNTRLCVYRHRVKMRRELSTRPDHCAGNVDIRRGRDSPGELRAGGEVFRPDSRGVDAGHAKWECRFRALRQWRHVEWALADFQRHKKFLGHRGALRGSRRIG